MKIEAIQGDITKITVDAIVNAANSSLMGGGGVDGAIHRAGGPEILADCEAIVRRQGKCRVGEAVITSAGRLPARHVIHTVGPIWNGGKNKEADLLANCYRNSLMLAQKHGLRSIAFPAISTGVYRFPKQAAAEIAVATVREFWALHPDMERIAFVCFDAESLAIYQQLLAD
jgi:O-acetyl-ADP-ribose deacetylase (regulator of RNase III)